MGLKAEIIRPNVQKEASTAQATRESERMTEPQSKIGGGNVHNNKQKCLPRCRRGALPMFNHGATLPHNVRRYGWDEDMVGDVQCQDGQKAQGVRVEVWLVSHTNRDRLGQCQRYITGCSSMPVEQDDNRYS